MDDIRKRLLYRATHRGTKEADRLVGGFAKDCLAALDDSLLDEFERLLDEADVDLMNWLTGKQDIPSSHQGAVMSQMVRYTQSL